MVRRTTAFARLSGPVFQFIRMVSPLSWTPLAIILLGVGDAPVYFLIAIGALWPIALNASAGVAALDPRWGMVSRSLGATPAEVLRTVVWPGIRPHVLTGLRLAVGLAWLILVPAEMLGVDSGLGYFTLNTRDRLAYGDLMAAILVIGACGFAIDSAARWAFRERRRPSPAVSPGSRARSGARKALPRGPGCGWTRLPRDAARPGTRGRVVAERVASDGVSRLAEDRREPHEASAVADGVCSLGPSDSAIRPTD